MATKLASQDAGSARPVILKKTLFFFTLLLSSSAVLMAQARTGDPLPGLSAEEAAQFDASSDAFAEADSVKGNFTSPVFGPEPSAGLGPRFNMVS